MRPWEIKRLTLYQIKNIYSHARKDDGSVKPKWIGPDITKSDEERMKAEWKRTYFLSDEQCEKKWQDFLYLEAYRFHLETNATPRPEQEEIERLVQAKRLEMLRRRDGIL